MAQDFSQRPVINYDEIYSPIVDAITFRFLISLTIHEMLEICLMDVVTTYLYGLIDNDVYMKIPEGFKRPETYNSNPQKAYSIKLQNSLYGLSILYAYISDRNGLKCGEVQ